ncbi:MAG TPA: SapC family protein [Sphingomicrobium sp.]|nr:SapC family protein [Sphingomicrobium sp.]
MANHVMLDSSAHRDLRVRTDSSPELGDAVMACFTVPHEFRLVQNEYPILFRRDLESGRFSALALLGFEAGENLYLDGGRWDARHRPWAMAVQPLLIGRPKEGDGPGQVHIDLGHPRIAAGEDGIRLFDELGQPTPFLDRAAAMLGELDEGYRESAAFYSALERHELLEPMSLDVELRDGSKHRLVGYHVIAEERLRGLDGEALAELHRDDYLLPIFMAMASLANLGALVARKNRAMGLG